MAYISITINTNDTTATVQNKISLTQGGHMTLNQIRDYLNGISAGTGTGARINYQLGSTVADGYLTFSGNPTNNQTCVVGNTTFTAKTSGATGNQFNIGSDSAGLTSAVALAAAINASVEGNAVLATVVGTSTPILHVTLNNPGALGNKYTLTTSLTNTAATAPTGGTDPTTPIVKNFGWGK